MTIDVVALLRQPPTAEALGRALLAAGPELRIGALADGAVLQLFDAQRTLVASIDAASRIDVDGECERLLDIASPPTPYWWLEAHVPTLQPHALAIAQAFARMLVRELGGTVTTT